MATSKQKKQEILAGLEDKISRSKSVFFTSYFGTGANEINELRAKFKENGAEYTVAKKTLVDLAFKNRKVAGVNAAEMAGEVATIFGYDDEVVPAKVLDDFAKGREEFRFLGGVLENSFITGDQVRQLAQLPSKQQLYAQVVGTINAPVSGFVNVLAGNLRGLVTALKQIEEKKA
jgi:large subunit ribosomal protein L10